MTLYSQPQNPLVELFKGIVGKLAPPIAKPNYSLPFVPEFNKNEFFGQLTKSAIEKEAQVTSQKQTQDWLVKQQAQRESQKALANLAIDMYPGVGDVKAVAEGVKGKTALGEPMAWWERGLSVASGVVPLIPSTVSMAKAVKAARKTIDPNLVMKARIGIEDAYSFQMRQAIPTTVKGYPSFKPISKDKALANTVQRLNELKAHYKDAYDVARVESIEEVLKTKYVDLPDYLTIYRGSKSQYVPGSKPEIFTLDKSAAEKISGKDGVVSSFSISKSDIPPVNQNLFLNEAEITLVNPKQVLNKEVSESPSFFNQQRAKRKQERERKK